MSSRTYVKRKRSITACRECQRRKQKCNRSQPCNHCQARGADEKCCYEDLASVASKAPRKPSIVQEHSPHLSPMHVRSHDGEAAESVTIQRGIADQAGYSNVAIGNALSTLQNTLCRVDTNILSTSGSSTNALPQRVIERYRKLVEQLPNQDIVAELTKIFTAEMSWLAIIIEEYFFNEGLSNWYSVKVHIANGELSQLQPDVLHFPALLFQLLAVVLQILPPSPETSRQLHLDGNGASERLSQKYSRLGLGVIELVGKDHPTITSVQHDILRGLWHKNCSQGTEAWRILGSAVRQAQDLGLHREMKVYQGREEDIKDVLPRIWYDEYKRRVWVNLFVWDSHMAIMLGRPRIIHMSDCTVKPPTDCEIPMELTTKIPMPPSSEPWISAYTIQSFTYGLSHKIHEMLSLNSAISDGQLYQDVQRLEDEVLFMMNSLPHCLRPYNFDASWDVLHPYLPLQRLQVGVTVNTFIMALHRPHAALHGSSRDAGIKAAVDTLNFQQRQFEKLQSHQYRIYGFSFYTINAGLFLSAIILDHAVASQQTFENISTALKEAIMRLTLMQEHSAMAKSGVDILRQCYQTVMPSTSAAQVPVPPHHQMNAGQEMNGLELSLTSAYLPEASVGSGLLSHGLDFNATMLESMGLIPELMLDPSLASSEWFNFLE